MEIYIDPFKFLPGPAMRILRSSGYWGKETDADWEELIRDFEKVAISMIRASVNFKAINESDKNLVIELCRLYIMSQLQLPLIQAQTYVEAGEIALTNFNEILDKIKENQREAGIIADEGSRKGYAGPIFS